MEARLIIVGGKANKGEIAFSPPAVIGRSRDADLTVVHPMISRQHCQVFEVDGLLMVRDLGSLNGTHIGDQRIKEAPLRPDAEFTVGPLTFRVRYQYDGDLDSTPAPVVAEQAGGLPDTETDEAPDFQAVGERPPSDGTAWDEFTADILVEDDEEEEPEPTPPPTLERPADATAVAEPADEESTDAAGEVEEEEEEEEEPEPRPPLLPEPPTAKPVADEPQADARDERQTEPVGQSVAAADEPQAPADEPQAPKKKKKGFWPFGRGKKKKEHTEEAAEDSTPPPSPLPPEEADDAAKQTKGEQADGAPEFLAAPSSDEQQRAPVQTDDDELNEFLKGLQ